MVDGAFLVAVFGAYAVSIWLVALCIFHFWCVPWMYRRAHAIAASRHPDLVIGDDHPYLSRWELWRPFGCQVAIHKITRSDDDRAPHDHVSWHGSIILSGGYIEHIGGRARWRAPGAVIFRRAETLHRLELPVNNAGINYCWTVWIRGPKYRDWGFMCAGGRWVQWEKFGQQGCD